LVLAARLDNQGAERLLGGGEFSFHFVDLVLSGVAGTV
jgi:hypothetical protein